MSYDHRTVTPEFGHNRPVRDLSSKDGAVITFADGHQHRVKPMQIRRFSEKVTEAPNGCWLWTGCKTPLGYPRMSLINRTIYAHRFAYQIHVGPIPDGLVLDHLCRTPACVNPEHLEAVTQQENTLRGNGPAARNAAATECVHGHPFDDANTGHTKDGERYCRACGRNRAAERRNTEGMVTQ